MAYEQKTNHLMQPLKTDFDEEHWKNKYHSAGYWKSIIEFYQQCFLCSAMKRKKQSYQTGHMSQLFQ